MARGLAFIGVALIFGIQSTRYPLGDLAHAGPGLFPLLVSGIVGAIGLLLVVSSRFQAVVRLEFNIRNIAVVLGSLIGFAVLTQFVGALIGVVFLVFFSALAGERYDWKRNVRISLALMLIAYLFCAVLGVGLRLY
jgi:hypothetical protein